MVTWWELEPLPKVRVRERNILAFPFLLGPPIGEIQWQPAALGKEAPRGSSL